MANRGAVGRYWWCAVAASLLLACGGSATTSPGGASGAGGGEPGGAGAAGAGTGKGCVYEGKSYADGAGFPASDGCNTCSCNDGEVGCTLLGCSTGCQYGGRSYKVGESFKADCNTCTCAADGSVMCTLVECQNQCSGLQDQYAAALKQAKVCDPKKANQCTKSVSEGIPCGCSTPVNPKNTAAVAELEKLTTQGEAACGIASCAPCEAPPGPPICNEAGSCEYDVPPHLRACKVDGVVYPSGSTGIPKPGDCNKCSCIDGQVTNCTEMGCPPESDCPAGTVASTQCAQCGPTDNCEIVETACLPTCTDTCATGVCRNGFCEVQ